MLVGAEAGPRQRDRCSLELARIECAGTWPADAALRPLWDRIAPSSLVLVLSDFYDDAAVDLAIRLAAARREVLTIQLIGADERNFPFAGGHRFVDDESGRDRRVDATSVRDDFLERFANARRALAARFAAAGIAHAEYVLDTPVDTPLRRFFGGRAERVRA